MKRVLVIPQRIVCCDDESNIYFLPIPIRLSTVSPIRCLRNTRVKISQSIASPTRDRTIVVLNTAKEKQGNNTTAPTAGVGF
jgi:hypothetical protein